MMADTILSYYVQLNYIKQAFYNVNCLWVMLQFGLCFVENHKYNISCTYKIKLVSRYQGDGSEETEDVNSVP